MEKAGAKPRIMIDCSHANSGKDHRKQGSVCHSVAGQVASGERHIMGVMIESNLVAGSQPLINGKAPIYGQSITDACIGWTETQVLLRELAAAVRTRRSKHDIGTYLVPGCARSVPIAEPRFLCTLLSAHNSEPATQ